jgi:adenine-specific DNA-methyltransferase
MTHRRQKLELTWIGKETSPRLEPRILLEDHARSYHAPHRVSENDRFDNRLIFGDNLLALKALEQEFTGKVKCIYIDPPFNTGQAFAHYDDGVEHSLWLSLMRDRLEILRKLLTAEGSIWVHLDDNEVFYLKIVMDEIFGRQNFIASVTWRAADSSNNDATQFSLDHNLILAYSSQPNWKANKLARTEEANAHYSNPDNDPRGPWFSGNLSSPNPRPNLRFDINSPTGQIIKPPANGWRWSKENIDEKIASGEIIFSKDGTRIIRKTYLEDQSGLSPSTLWDNIEETGHNRQAKYELKKLFPGVQTAELFRTPKPERLLHKIIHIATNPGDLVLDSFAGSGTTGAVAHKMGRRWIMVELGDHCHTHIIPRLQKVIDGADQGGITASVGWQGGGGFRYFRLAPSLLEKDRWGNWVINKQYNAAMLAEAACKLEGFTYAPSETHYWQQGQASESDFLYVTTQTLTHEQLQALSEEVGPQRTLLVLCAAYRGFAGDPYPNLTIKKIPQAVLARCEYGRDDYSLQVENLPANRASNDNAASAGPVAGPGAEAATGQRKRLQMGLFGEEKS